VNVPDVLPNKAFLYQITFWWGNHTVWTPKSNFKAYLESAPW